MQVNFILQHGWGFDRHIWTQWHERLREIADARLLIADRGYFQTPAQLPALHDAFGSSIDSLTQTGDSEPTLSVLVTHSLGLHLVPLEYFQHANLLVIVGGFLHFHPTDLRAGQVSRRIISRMKDKVSKDVRQVLADFHAGCFGNASTQWPLIPLPPRDEANVELLGHDLHLLDTAYFNPANVPGQCRVLVLHGMDDTIVRWQAAEALAEVFPESRLVTYEHGTHALPFTHAEACCLAIARELRQLKAPGTLPVS